MTQVFLSYSRQDEATAKRVVELLERSGVSVWWDETLEPSQRYRSEILNQAEAADFVLVLWSPASVSSRWVIEEAILGMQTEKLVPLKINPCTPPPGLAAVQAGVLPSTHAELFIDRLAARMKKGPSSRSNALIAPRNQVSFFEFNQIGTWNLLAGSTIMTTAAIATLSLVSERYNVQINAAPDGEFDRFVLFTIIVFLNSYFGRWILGQKHDPCRVNPDPFLSRRQITSYSILLIFTTYFYFDDSLGVFYSITETINTWYAPYLVFIAAALGALTVGQPLISVVLRLVFSAAAFIEKRQLRRKSTARN